MLTLESILDSIMIWEARAIIHAPTLKSLNITLLMGVESYWGSGVLSFTNAPLTIVNW